MSSKSERTQQLAELLAANAQRFAAQVLNQHMATVERLMEHLLLTEEVDPASTLRAFQLAGRLSPLVGARTAPPGMIPAPISPFPVQATASALDDHLADLMEQGALTPREPTAAENEQEAWFKAQDEPLDIEDSEDQAAQRRGPGRPMRGRGAKGIQVSLERGLLERVDEARKDLGVSRSQLISRSLEATLAEREGTMPWIRHARFHAPVRTQQLDDGRWLAEYRHPSRLEATAGFVAQTEEEARSLAEASQWMPLFRPGPERF